MSRYRILALADSDSYLKFACATLDRMPGWDRRVAVVRSPLRPTSAQTAAAIEGTFLANSPPEPVALALLRAAIAGADVILSAATGPVTEEVFAEVHRRSTRRQSVERLFRRPALVSALPGVALPATARTVDARRLGDAFIAHSHAERRAYAVLMSEMGIDQDILVTRLPFLHGGTLPIPVHDTVTRIVFAPQAMVPASEADRAHILRRLAALARARPDIDVVVKLRAWVGQPQTHGEPHAYDRIWAMLAAEGVVTGHELSFRTGAIGGMLSRGTALVTVSSTAALEAIAEGLPVLILDEFGVGGSLLNGVFTGSGLFGSLDALSRLDFRHPAADWLADNYFHAAGDANTQATVDFGAAALALARRSRAGLLESRGDVRPAGWRARARRRVRLTLPDPLAQAARRVRAGMAGR